MPVTTGGPGTTALGSRAKGFQANVPNDRAPRRMRVLVNWRALLD